MLPRRLRDRLYDRLERQARTSRDERDFERAARIFRRMVHLAPRRPGAWHGLANSLLEAGDPEGTLEALDAAEAEGCVAPLDFLELEIAAAQRAGRHERARSSLKELHERAPQMARGFVQECGYQELAEECGIGQGEHDEEGGVKGYV